MENNRRQYPRSPSYIIANYTVAEGTFRDVIKNIGASGLFIRTEKRIAAGQAISIEFPLFQFEDIIKVTGRIVRKDTMGFAVTFNRPLHRLISNKGEFPKIVHESDRSTSD